MMEKCNTYNTENLPPATSLAYFGIKNGHPHWIPKRKKVMKKKNDIYKLGCCFFVNNRRIFQAKPDQIKAD